MQEWFAMVPLAMNLWILAQNSAAGATQGRCAD
jgi:hypothetical protein